MLQVLIDEDYSSVAAERLRDRGHDARSVAAALDKGATDAEVIEYADAHGLAVVTNDQDFLDPEYSKGMQVLFVHDERMPAHRLARVLDELDDLAAQADLGRVYHVTERDL